MHTSNHAKKLMHSNTSSFSPFLNEIRLELVFGCIYFSFDCLCACACSDVCVHVCVACRLFWDESGQSTTNAHCFAQCRYESCVSCARTDCYTAPAQTQAPRTGPNRSFLAAKLRAQGLDHEDSDTDSDESDDELPGPNLSASASTSTIKGQFAKQAQAQGGARTPTPQTLSDVKVEFVLGADPGPTAAPTEPVVTQSDVHTEKASVPAIAPSTSPSPSPLPPGELSSSPPSSSSAFARSVSIKAGSRVQHSGLPASPQSVHCSSMLHFALNAFVRRFRRAHTTFTNAGVFTKQGSHAPTPAASSADVRVCGLRVAVYLPLSSWSLHRTRHRTPVSSFLVCFLFFTW